MDILDKIYGKKSAGLPSAASLGSFCEIKIRKICFTTLKIRNRNLDKRSYSNKLC